MEITKNQDGLGFHRDFACFESPSKHYKIFNLKTFKGTVQRDGSGRK
jgi:hypothetical protein